LFRQPLRLRKFSARSAFSLPYDSFPLFRLSLLALLALTPVFAQPAAPAAAVPPAALQVAPGFKVELIYTVPKEDQAPGSR